MYRYMYVIVCVCVLISIWHSVLVAVYFTAGAVCEYPANICWYGGLLQHEALHHS